MARNSIANQIRDKIPCAVGADLGSSKLKLFNGVNQVATDTIIVNGSSATQSLDGSSVNEEITEVLVDEQWFTVGDNSFYCEPITTHGITRLETAVRPALFQHVARIANLCSKNVILTSSVPTNLIKNKKLVEAVKKAITLPCNIKGYTTCNIKANLLLAEASSSAWSILYDQDLNTHDYIEEGMSLFLYDIGGYTLDTALIHIKDGKQIIDSNFSRNYDDCGVKFAEEHFLKLAQQRINNELPGVSINSRKAKIAFKYEKLTIQGKTFDLTTEKELALLALAQKIQRIAVEKIPNEFDLYCFTGGGTQLIKDFIAGKKTGMPKWYSNFHIPKNSVMSGATGNYIHSLSSALALARQHFGANLTAQNLLDAWYG